MWIEEKTVLLAQIHTQKNRIIDNNRCDIGLFCCEFLDRVIFEESDRVTACGGTSFFFCRIKGFQLGNVCRLFPRYIYRFRVNLCDRKREVFAGGMSVQAKKSHLQENSLNTILMEICSAKG